MESKHREHGRPRYQKGCQCAACVAAKTTAPCRCSTCVGDNRAYSRRNKQLRLVVGGRDTAPAQPGPGIRPERDPGKLVETQIQKALDQLGDVPEKMPDLAAGALAMGRLLDDPRSGPQHPGAVGQMRALMKDLRSALAATSAGNQDEPKKEKRGLTSFRGGRGA